MRLEMYASWHRLESQSGLFVFGLVVPFAMLVALSLVPKLSPGFNIVYQHAFFAVAETFLFPVVFLVLGIGTSATVGHRQLFYLVPSSRISVGVRQLGRRLAMAGSLALATAVFNEESLARVAELTLRYFAMVTLGSALPRRYARPLLPVTPLFLLVLSSLRPAKLSLVHRYEFGVMPTALVAVVAASLFLWASRLSEAE